MSQVGRTRSPAQGAEPKTPKGNGMYFGLENRTLVLVIIAIVVVVIVGIVIWRRRQSSEPKKDNHVIKSGCRSDAECPSGKHCRTSTGVCVECTGDEHCAENPNGSHCDVASSSCVACLTTQDCPEGQECMNHTCASL